MKIPNYNYYINLTNKQKITISRVNYEWLAMALSGSKRPQFINIDDEIINTSFIISIEKEDDWGRKEVNKEEMVDLAGREAEVHKKYLQLRGTTLEETKQLK